MDHWSTKSSQNRFLGYPREDVSAIACRSLAANSWTILSAVSTAAAKPLAVAMESILLRSLTENLKKKKQRTG